jgi:hypothetical protein
LNKWKITTCFMAIGFLIARWLNPNHPSMAHLVACDYSKCSHKCSRNLGFHVILSSSMAMDEIFCFNYKVCNYIFNFMAMSCLLWLIDVWHLSKATRLFLVTFVHYNYKWVTNSVIDCQISFNGRQLPIIH